MDRILEQTRAEIGALRSRLEARQIRTAGEEPRPIDHEDLLPLVHAINLLLERAAKSEE